MAPRLHQRAALIVAAARAFPEAYVTVACGVADAGCSATATVSDRCWLSRSRCSTKGGTSTAREARVQVATWAGLNESGSGYHLFPETPPGRVHWSLFFHSLGQYQNVHVYGFTNGKRAALAGRYAADVAWRAVSGASFLRSRATRVIRPRFALWSPMAWTRQQVEADRQGPCAKSCQAIWHADRRNAAVAGLADAFASGRRDELYRFGLSPDDVALGTLNGRATRVAVLVECLEHARTHSPRVLPGWPVLDRNFSDASRRRVGESDGSWPRRRAGDARPFDRNGSPRRQDPISRCGCVGSRRGRRITARLIWVSSQRSQGHWSDVCSWSILKQTRATTGRCRRPADGSTTTTGGDGPSMRRRDGVLCPSTPARRSPDDDRPSQ